MGCYSCVGLRFAAKLQPQRTELSNVHLSRAGNLLLANMLKLQFAQTAPCSKAVESKSGISREAKHVCGVLGFVVVCSF